MKSAYELAMERLLKEDPAGGPSLTRDQKDELAEIDRIYQAKIAEKEIFLKGKLRDARMKRDYEATGQLETQMQNERLRLDEEREKKKNQVREQGA